MLIKCKAIIDERFEIVGKQVLIYPMMLSLFSVPMALKNCSS
jgi:hypothetical protein